MDLKLAKHSASLSGEIFITGSKSESNRLLILQALFPSIKIKNLSNSDDTQVLQKALGTSEGDIDIHHAGTAMRFLTSFFASRKGKEVVLTGSERMRQRPIKLLVEALRELGADITYLEEEGFPPLAIKGKDLVGQKVVLPANISSQYISSLILIAPSLPRGLEIVLEGPITSEPYIRMSLSLLAQAGIAVSFEGKIINIGHKGSIGPVTYRVESDWSSASYFYSLAALSREAKIRLFSYREKSLQGDMVVAQIYEQLGVRTEFSDNSILLSKVPAKKPRKLVLNLTDSPDLAQTIAVTCFGLGLACELHGLHTLKIKETDRLQALKTELERLGGAVEITTDCLVLQAREGIMEDIRVKTYNDHRMAMAFAPLALKTPLIIEDAGVVSKSFPGFWQELRNMGFPVS